MKSVLRLLCFVSLTTLIPSMLVGQDKQMTILSGEVTVTARLKEAPIGGSYFIGITVSRDFAGFKYNTVITAVKNQEQAVSALRKDVGWKAGFFFVRLECGGGNAWRCNREEVFAIRQGRIDRNGEILGGDRGESPGRYYIDGWFIDLYDKFERNYLTAHAFSPGIWLYSRAIEGRLQVDLSETWLRNRKKFDENLGMTDGLLAPDYPYPSERDSNLTQALLQNAVLAKYCRRNPELQSTIAVANAHIAKDSLERFLKIVSEVVPGELPRQR